MRDNILLGLVTGDGPSAKTDLKMKKIFERIYWHNPFHLLYPCTGCSLRRICSHMPIIIFFGSIVVYPPVELSAVRRGTSLWPKCGQMRLKTTKCVTSRSIYSVYLPPKDQRGHRSGIPNGVHPKPNESHSQREYLATFHK